MATFTMRLCDLVDEGYAIGLTTTDYPIFDEAYRPVLNQRITDHYALYEIGQETPNMFKFALNRRMREIMRYYNQLYLSEQITFDPMSTMDYTDTTDTSNAVDTVADSTSDNVNDSTSHNTNNSDSKSRVVNSELPQVHLSPDEDYASSGADSTNLTDATGDGVSHSTDETVVHATGGNTANGESNHHATGRQGTGASLLMEYRVSLLNIDMMVINDLVNLFMGVWQTSDSYSQSERGFDYVTPALQSPFI
jgi:hypothetical protein